MMQLSETQARALLEWYVAMGADCAIAESTTDRFAIAEEKRTSAAASTSPTLLPRSLPPRATSQSTPPRQPAVTSPILGDEGAIAEARRLAAAAQTLDELRAGLESFEGCGLKRTASRLVFSDGTPGSRLMLVGEAPGRDEDIQGKPFVGRSGQLLDRILAAIGLDRGSVYIANVVPWRPPGNRTPTPQELAVCLPFIERQIELAGPALLVLLGGAAMSALTGTSAGIVKSRGQWLQLRIRALEIKAMPTFHPAYLLRNPLSKRQVWKDFLDIRQALQLL